MNRHRTNRILDGLPVPVGCVGTLPVAWSYSICMRVISAVMVLSSTGAGSASTTLAALGGSCLRERFRRGAIGDSVVAGDAAWRRLLLLPTVTAGLLSSASDCSESSLLLLLPTSSNSDSSSSLGITSCCVRLRFGCFVAAAREETK